MNLETGVMKILGQVPELTSYIVLRQRPPASFEVFKNGTIVFIYQLYNTTCIIQVNQAMIFINSVL